MRRIAVQTFMQLSTTFRSVRVWVPALALLAMAPFAILLVLNLNAQRARVISDSQTRLLRQLELTTYATETWIGRAARLLDALSRSHGARHLTCDGWFDEITALEQTITSIAITDPDGRVTCSAGLDGEAPEFGALRDAAIFQASLKFPGTHFNGASYSKVHQSWQLVSATTIIDEGNVAGVLFANFSLAESGVEVFPPYVEEYVLALVDDKGRYLGRSREPERFVGSIGSPKIEIAAEAGRESPAQLTFRPGTNFARLSVFVRRVRATNWLVIGSMKTSEIAAPQVQAALNSALYLVLATAFVVLTAIVLGRSIGKPIIALSNLAKDLEADPQAVFPSVVRGPEEVQTLAQSLNSLFIARNHAEERMRRVLDGTSSGWWEFDVPSKRVHVSPKLLAFLGVPDGSQALSPSFWRSRVHPDDLKRYDEEVAAAAAARRTDVEMEYRARVAGGEYAWLRSAVHVEYDAQMRAIRSYGTIQDISAQRAIENQLAQADKLAAVGQLAGGIAHDVNNDLAVILGSAELIAEKSEPGSRIRQMADRIIKVVARSSDLVQRMLAFSRKSEMQPVVLDLAAVVQDVAATLRRTLGGGIDIDIIGTDEAVCISVDRALLESCLINLSVNARDAMPKGGRLTFTISPGSDETDDKWAVLSVADTGAGMPEDVRKRVFEPFFTTKQMGGGTGLGLAMVYGFVQQSGGTIDVESVPGRGTMFTLRFPRADRKGLPHPESHRPRTLARAQRVLLVDDNALVRKTLREQLETMGCSVIEAATAEEAKQCFRERSKEITFVLSDLDLGAGPSGTDLAEWIANEGYDCPGAIVSGYLNVPSDRIAMTGWSKIQKPVSADALFRLLSNATPKHA